MLEEKMPEEKLLEEKVLEKLLSRGLHISFVESCTGGLLAATLINVSGASGAIEQSFVTYSNNAKHRMVGVSLDTLEQYGAVSSKTAMEMAQGGARVGGSDICVSVTGVAGPSMEEGKPVGLVYIGIYYDGNVKAYECHFTGSRKEIREQAVERALQYVLEMLQ